MASVPLISNPILPPVPDEPKDMDDKELQDTFDKIWKWMKDVSVQLKILFGSPNASNSAITIPLVQAGTVLPFAGVVGNIPTGYLACDGSVVSQSQYVALFSAIGSTWNTGGEGAGNFRLPDFQGRSIIGQGTGAGLTARAPGQTGGEETHILTVAELAAHSHPVTDPGHVHGYTDPGHHHTEQFDNGIFGPNQTIAGGPNRGFTPSPLNTVDALTGIFINSAVTGISTVNTGGGGAHNTMMPYGVCVWMIKF